MPLVALHGKAGVIDELTLMSIAPHGLTSNLQTYFKIRFLALQSYGSIQIGTKNCLRSFTGTLQQTPNLGLLKVQLFRLKLHLNYFHQQYLWSRRLGSAQAAMRSYLQQTAFAFSFIGQEYQQVSHQHSPASPPERAPRTGVTQRRQ